MNFLVTGGGTVAPIDDVRQISNSSTGRFSSAITEAILRRGGRAWHLHAPGALVPFAARSRVDLDADPASEADRLRLLKAEWDECRDRLRLVPLRLGTVPEYAEALRSLLSDRPIDAVILAMAASDYAPEPGAGKLDSTSEELIIRCRRLPKVIRSVRDWAPRAYLVGFKLLSGSTEAELVRRAQLAGLSTRADLTVANDLQQLRAGRHRLHLVRPGGRVETLGPAADLADRLVERIWGWAEVPRGGSPG